MTNWPPCNPYANCAMNLGYNPCANCAAQDINPQLIYDSYSPKPVYEPYEYYEIVSVQDLDE